MQPVSLAVLAACTLTHLPLTGSAGAQPTAEQAAWIKQHAVPITTVEAGHGFDDLQPLKAMIGGARIVGLGEGTHGTREFFQAKHRLLEFLVEEMGFTIFSIEANMPEAYALNDYVLGGEGDVNALIGGMYFWTWNTEEVRDMVEWMRAYNAARKEKGETQRVQFTGFDMQTGAVALRLARGFLEQHDPAFVDANRASLDLLAEFNPMLSMSSGFGCATGQFPVELARGKRVKFSGWAKTESLKDGWAGLWWRVDGPTQKFDNMADRGLRGTTNWTELAIEMDIPADAEAIYFGLVMPGRGKGWFDGLKIEIDGEAWESTDFDLGFEGTEPRGIVSSDPMGGRGDAGYAMTMDADVKHSGAQSARLASILPPDAKSPEETLKEASSAAESLLGGMIGAREKYAAADANAAEWAIQNMRVVSQWVGMGADMQNASAHRDECMAENARWIMDQNPGAKMVIWAHNWHVRDEAPWMGSHMRRLYGKEYVNVAFCSSRGSYYAISRKRGRGVFNLAAPKPDSFEAMLETAESPIVMLDIRAASAGDPGSGWLTEARPFGGIIGAMEMPEHYFPTQMPGKFDLLLYVRETTPARQLQTKPGPTPAP